METGDVSVKTESKTDAVIKEEEKEEDDE